MKGFLLSLLLMSFSVGAQAAGGIACGTMPAGALTAERPKLEGSSGYGFCQALSCDEAQGYLAAPANGKCVKAEKVSWFTQNQSLERADVSLTLRAKLDRAASSAKSFPITVQGGSPQEMQLMDTQAAFAANATLSSPITLKIKRPTGDMPQTEINLLVGGQALKVTLLAFGTAKPVMSLSFENDGQGISSASPSDQVMLKASVNRAISTLFATAAKVKLSTPSGEQTVSVSIPKGQTSASVQVGPFAVGTVVADLSAPPAAVTKGAGATLQIEEPIVNPPVTGPALTLRVIKGSGDSAQILLMDAGGSFISVTPWDNPGDAVGEFSAAELGNRRVRVMWKKESATSVSMSMSNGEMFAVDNAGGGIYEFDIPANRLANMSGEVVVTFTDNSPSTPTPTPTPQPSTPTPTPQPIAATLTFANPSGDARIEAIDWDGITIASSLQTDRATAASIALTQAQLNTVVRYRLSGTITSGTGHQIIGPVSASMMKSGENFFADINKSEVPAGAGPHAFLMQATVAPPQPSGVTIILKNDGTSVGSIMIEMFNGVSYVPAYDRYSDDGSDLSVTIPTSMLSSNAVILTYQKEIAPDSITNSNGLSKPLTQVNKYTIEPSELSALSGTVTYEFKKLIPDAPAAEPVTIFLKAPPAVNPWETAGRTEFEVKDLDNNQIAVPGSSTPGSDSVYTISGIDKGQRKLVFWWYDWNNGVSRSKMRVTTSAGSTEYFANEYFAGLTEYQVPTSVLLEMSGTVTFEFIP